MRLRIFTNVRIHGRLTIRLNLRPFLVKRAMIARFKQEYRASQLLYKFKPAAFNPSAIAR